MPILGRWRIYFGLVGGLTFRLASLHPSLSLEPWITQI
jgi:hypothetical protein